MRVPTGALVAAALLALAGANNAAASRAKIWAGEIRDVLAPGVIQAISDPQTVAAGQVSMSVDEPVIGVSINGQARAYSVYLLNSHEVVNDTVGGKPVAVTWCPLANLAVVYSREVGDTVRTFEASGALLKNTVVLLDYRTDSLWTAISGQAIVGPSSGERLQVVPSWQKIRWGTWFRMHPDTTVATYDGVQTPGVDSYADYHKSGMRTGIHAVRHRDRRLPVKSMVIGLDVEGRRKAYPFDDFDRSKVISDQVGGVPILLYRDKATQNTAVYDRRLDDVELDFGKLKTKGFYRDTDDRLADSVTGTVWDLRTGVAVAGPFAGRSLTPVPFTNVYWFVWADYYPKTRMYK